MQTTLARLFNGAMIALQTVLGIAGFAVTTILLRVEGYSALPAISLTVLFGFLATLVHEGGHWLGARLGGMTVIQAGAYGVEIQPQLRGARLRYTRRRKGQPFSGYVMAVDSPNQPWRRARMLMIAGGPVMNLLVGTLTVAIALATLFHMGLLLAFAAINLTLGVANLVPTFRKMHSNGGQLLAWWRRPDESGPDFAYTRLLALSVAGVNATELPQADLDSLARQPMPLPLVALSYRLTALQIQGDWANAVALEAPFKQMLSAHPEVQTTLAASVALVRRELEFSRAMLEGTPTALILPVQNPDVDWYSPALTHRCRALQAALAGDRNTVESELAKAEKLAHNSPVKSAVALQGALSGYIRAVMPPHQP